MFVWYKKLLQRRSGCWLATSPEHDQSPTACGCLIQFVFTRHDVNEDIKFTLLWFRLSEKYWEVGGHAKSAGPKKLQKGTKEMRDKKFPVCIFFAGSMMLRTLGLTQWYNNLLFHEWKRVIPLIDPVRNAQQAFQMEVHAVHVVVLLSCSHLYQGMTQIKTSDFIITSCDTRVCIHQWR
jgi:hypothetical protein